jgi:hypothetical protein
LVKLWEVNYRVYGVRKLWKAAQRAGNDVGRDQVARHMRAAGITGVRRGKRVRTIHLRSLWRAARRDRGGAFHRHGRRQFRQRPRGGGYLGDVPPAEFEATFYATKQIAQPLVEIQ